MAADETRRPVDLVLRGATLVTAAGEWSDLAVAVRDGVIVALGRPEVMPPADEVLDLSGRHLMPGAIDAHVHFRDPGMSAKEGFEAGSGSAALGGVTCVIDMPNTEPPIDTAARLAGKLAMVEGRSWVDYGCYGLLTGDNLDELADLHAHGVVGVKCFMGQSETGPGCPMPPDDGVLVEAMTRLASLGMRLAVHAENHSIMLRRRDRLRRAGSAGLDAHRASRPPFVEAEAVQRVGIFARHTGCGVHVLHVSSAEAAETVVAQRANGVDMTAETCPHYLMLSDTEEPSLRVNPPIRTSADAEALASALASGRIDMIASDHAPHLASEKHGDDVWHVNAGLNGVQHLLPLLLSERERLGLSLPDIVRVASTMPARIWGLWPRKGDLVVGGDADFTVVDLARNWTIEPEEVYSRNGLSPYVGWSGRGAPVATIVRGRTVARDGVLVGSPSGRWVRGNPGESVPRAQDARYQKTKAYEQGQSTI